jgi:coenzyme F420-0:L-glutamate ligase/coenzyme F420-1:gamma-L-glutamate ligase
LMAVQSTAMATQNLLLAAHAEGLGACWMCAPLFCPDRVAEALRLPKGWDPQALVTLGRPANSGKPAARHPVEAVTWNADRQA